MSNDIQIRRRQLSDYAQDPQNANTGSQRGAEMISDSLAQVGPGRSLLADGHDRLVAGNKTQLSATTLGVQDVIEVETDGDAIIVHKRRDWDLLDPEDKRARLAAYYDNRASELGLSWNADQIAADFQSGIDMGGLFDPGELALLVGNETVYGQLDDELAGSSDNSPASETLADDLLAKWDVQSGQVWAIPSKHGGQHKIVCGDSGDPDAVAQMFADGEQAQIVFTSPPYGMRRAANAVDANDYGGIPEDEYVEWFNAIQACTRQHLIGGGSFFINIKPHSSKGERALYVFDLVLAMRREWGWKFVDEHCWLRVTAPGSWPDRLKNGFEPIYQFATAGDGRVFEPQRMGTRSEQVMRKGQKAKQMTSTGTHYNISEGVETGIALPTNVVEVQGVRTGIAHSAMYPVALPQRFMMIYANRGDIIFDPFLGSGTNIHAAEQTRRLSYGVELLPQHVAIMLEEWSQAGYAPELLAD